MGIRLEVDYPVNVGGSRRELQDSPITCRWEMGARRVLSVFRKVVYYVCLYKRVWVYCVVDALNNRDAILESINVEVVDINRLKKNTVQCDVNARKFPSQVINFTLYKNFIYTQIYPYWEVG